jgi:hypothetical protein
MGLPSLDVVLSLTAGGIDLLVEMFATPTVEIGRSYGLLRQSGRVDEGIPPIFLPRNQLCKSMFNNPFCPTQAAALGVWAIFCSSIAKDDPEDWMF